MKRITISQIENAFLPAKEITDPERFSGRKQYVKDAYLALIADGANIAIVGNRGIGKSSLARQIINIGSGNNQLLKKLELPSDETLDYLPIYYACGRAAENINILLTKLLTTKNCLLEWIYEIPTATKELNKINGGLDIKIAKIGSAVSEEETKSTALTTHPIDVIFQNVTSDIVKSKIAKNGILIVIDEFDQIADPSGFASLLKSMATNVPKVKFCIVGVAHDLQNLMKEHQSSDRLFAGSVINLPPMLDFELADIIKKAETSINNFITFEEPAIKKLIELAQGHPYVIHLLGKYALRTAYFNSICSINENLIIETLNSIAEKEADPVLEGRYKKAVASSPQREAVLKSFAETVVDGEILTTEAYKKAVERDVENPSQYVGQLVTEDYGAELIKIRECYYRFKDSLFLTYVKARPPIFKSKATETMD